MQRGKRNQEQAMPRVQYLRWVAILPASIAGIGPLEVMS
jgi:hypothetical protein